MNWRPESTEENHKNFNTENAFQTWGGTKSKSSHATANIQLRLANTLRAKGRSGCLANNNLFSFHMHIVAVKETAQKWDKYRNTAAAINLYYWHCFYGLK
jgi:hypothetical protein